MVNLIGMDREQVKEAFILFAEECNLFIQTIEDIKEKSNEKSITPDILNKTLAIFEKKIRYSHYSNIDMRIGDSYYSNIDKRIGDSYYSNIDKLKFNYKYLISIYAKRFHDIYDAESTFCFINHEVKPTIEKKEHQHKSFFNIYQADNNYTSNFIMSNVGSLIEEEHYSKISSFINYPAENTCSNYLEPSPINNILC